MTSPKPSERLKQLVSFVRNEPMPWRADPAPLPMFAPPTRPREPDVDALAVNPFGDKDDE